MTAPASAATLGIVATGANLQFALRPKGRAVFLACLLGALPADLLLSYLPVRAALRQHWHRPSRSEDHA